MYTLHHGKRNIELLAIALLLNVAAFGLYGALFAQMKAKNEHVSELANEIEAGSSAEQALHSVKTVVSETALLRGKLQGYIVPKDGAVPFIELLESTGRDAKVTVTIVSVEEPELAGREDVDTLRITLRGAGSWREITRFLGLLELLPVESKVEQVTISHGGQEESRPWAIDATVTALKAK
ncbi:MAG: hypothetical protein Q7R54_00045 [bacterium]|nr:hypothetical protein [bacterium]